ncbi:MAG: DUF6165 family protein [Pseudomonadota bacterium]
MSANPSRDNAIVHIPVSIGELVDKLTILEIKNDEITDTAKLERVRRELSMLQAEYDKIEDAEARIATLRQDLKSVNRALWTIEDQLRLKEAKQEFDEDFVSLARSVYRTNDERHHLKTKIDAVLGSALSEAKSYAGT